MSFTYDLRQEAWIPCLSRTGEAKLLGLEDVLIQAHHLQEISDNSPLVTVALHRLLLAILYRCWSVKSDEEWDILWLRLWEMQKFPAEDVKAYFSSSKCNNRFDLFSEVSPFYQTAGLEIVKSDTVKKEKILVTVSDANIRLANEAPDSSNATLFDHRTYASLKSWTPAEAARYLVASQSFGTCTSKTGQARIGSGPVLEPPGRNDGIALRGLTVWLTGESLFQTLLFNFVPYENWDFVSLDLPAWEQEDTLPQIVSSWKTCQRPNGPAERYTWQGRLVRLLPEETTDGIAVRTIYYTQGRCTEKINDAPDDFMKSYNRDKKTGWKAVPLRADKAAWRDCHALLSIKKSDFKPPAALRYVSSLIEEGSLALANPVGVDVVGLAGGGEAAKFLLWRHDRLSVPATLLKSEDLVALLGLMVDEAEAAAVQLKKVVKNVAHRFLPPHGNPAPKDVANFTKAMDACPAYWARLENHFTDLLEGLPQNEEVAVAKWRQQVKREMRSALQEFYYRLGNTPQAMRAIAMAQNMKGTQTK